MDNPTDGLLILAKDEATRQLMEKAFRERAVCKRYTCLVRGTPAPAHATLQAYLRKHADVAAVEILDYPAHGALPIRTDARVLGATLRAGETADYALGKDRKAYLVPASGAVEIDGVRVNARDGAAISDIDVVTITAIEDSEIVLVDVL